MWRPRKTPGGWVGKPPALSAEMKCYDCDSPERICRALVGHYRPVNQMEMDVVLIDQELGY